MPFILENRLLMELDKYEPNIGLEIHAQLSTESKIFCSCSTKFGMSGNRNICAVCMGMPGALPVLNKKVLEYAIRVGLSLNCKINSEILFSRKNYFYPDLPKGYQISQFDKPLCEEGYLNFYLGEHLKKIRIIRAHLEEDAGKSVHQGAYSLIDLNRSGVPLLEIVSYPDIKSPTEAAEYARAMRLILKYNQVCDGNLEEGSMRCDCNVSIKKKGAKEMGTKVEIKNLNSFRFIEKALHYEIHRQIDIVESGFKIIQETRHYDMDQNKTLSMRIKEEAQDYKYFPDPDLLSIKISENWVSLIKSQQPVSPENLINELQKEYGLTFIEAVQLVEERDRVDYFFNTVKICNNGKAACHWIINEIIRYLNENKKTMENIPISPHQLGGLIKMLDGHKISLLQAKAIFNEVWHKGGDPEDIAKTNQLFQINDDHHIELLIDQVIKDFPKEVSDYRNGKEKIFGFLVGQIMKKSKKAAAPHRVNELLKKKIRL